MKNLHIIGAVVVACIVVLCLAAIAAPDMTEPFTWSSVSASVSATNTGDSVTNKVYLNGWVDMVVLDWTDSGGALTQTATVSIATQGGTGSGPSRSILTLTAIPCTDTTPYFPRATGQGLTGSSLSTIVGERVPLVQDKLVVSAFGTTQTNIVALTVRVITSPSP